MKARMLGAVCICTLSVLLLPLNSNATTVSLILESDNADDGQAQIALLATGKFSSIDQVDVLASGLPTLATLLNYDSVLAYTNYAPSDPVGFGDLLADYVDSGGRVVLATYAFSDPWAIRGGIVSSGYSPLTNSNVIGSPDGSLVATNPSDPIFNGITLGSVSYFYNSSFAQPELDAGAELLATDGAGTNMIARNLAGNVIGINLFPSGQQYTGNNAEFFNLVANTMTVRAVPIPPALWLFGSGLIGLVGMARRKATT